MAKKTLPKPKTTNQLVMKAVNDALQRTAESKELKGKIKKKNDINKKNVYVRTGYEGGIKTEIAKTPPKTAKKIGETKHLKRYSMMGKEILVPKKNVVLKKQRR